MGFLAELIGVKPYPKHASEEVDRLLNELLRIGKTDDFLSERPGGVFNVQCRHNRAIEIGKRLNAIGGVKLMEYSLRRIKKKLGNALYTHLEFAWDDLGSGYLK